MVTRMALLKKPCNKMSCPQKGEVHERCRGHRRDGQPCTQRPIKGAFVCRMHGGSITQTKRAATRRLALVEANSIASRIVAFDDQYDEGPAEGLLREVRWSAQVALSLGDLVASLQDESVARV